MKFKIFISSVQKEFAEERKLLADYIRKDALLGIFFEVFLFEEMDACDMTPQGVYLGEVGGCVVGWPLVQRGSFVVRERAATQVHRFGGQMLTVLGV